jgi:hypothetical protein
MRPRRSPEYQFISNDSGGYDPVLTSGGLDPFPQIPFDIANFTQNSVDQSGDNYIVTLRGGRIANAGIERVEVLVDGQNKLIRTMTGYDSKGVVLLEGSITYQDKNPSEMKQMSLVVGDVTRKSTITSNVLLDEKNLDLEANLFTVKKP